MSASTGGAATSPCCRAPSAAETMTMMRARSLSGFGLGALLAASACSVPPVEGAGEPVDSLSAPIIKGKASDETQNAVILIVHYDPSQPNGVELCSGSLLAPSLVLTARHCVAKTSETAACDSEGNPIGSGAVGATDDPKTLYVFTGTDFPKFGGGQQVKPAAQGAQIIDDGAKNLCNHDIALVVLDTPITDMPIIPVRLESDVTEGESLTSIGWGVTDKDSVPTVRQQRTDVPVVAVGPADKRALPVPPNEFEVGESICSGDSGGPAVADTGAVVGVVSRGGNGKQPNQNDPASTCIGATNLYTKLSPFKDLILGAYETAGAEPWLEGGEDPRKAKAGEACEDASACRSNLCLADPSKASALTCARDCSSTPCEAGQQCVTEGDAKVCRTPAPTPQATTTTTTSGCSTSPAHTTGDARALLVAMGLACAVVGVRRRKSR